MKRATFTVLSMAAAGMPCIPPSETFAQDTILSSIKDKGSLRRGGQKGGGETILITIGDSLTQGTMDGTNNSRNTLHAYAQLVAESLLEGIDLRFAQPLWDDAQERIEPYLVPTNLGVDGSDIFSAEGLEYYKTVGAEESYLTDQYLCDARRPWRFDSKYDKALFPLNRMARQDVSQVDAAVTLLGEHLSADPENRAIVIFWLGNNDTSTAALGTGGENPMYIPVPVEQIESELSGGLRLLLGVAERIGLVAFDSYTPPAIERNMTDLADFTVQYNEVVDRITQVRGFAEGRIELFLLSLPYYSAVGYLMDSDDLEYYLGKRSAGYKLPRTFGRVAPPGEAITDPLAGDRISLLTFGMMYTLLATGHRVEEVNEVLESDGLQRDGMVLSEAEGRLISARIDEFNAVIFEAAHGRGPHVHWIDVGQYLNDGLAGKLRIEVGGKVIGRKWVRGSGFSLDGVHPGYTAQALIANYILGGINKALGVGAPQHDLEAVFAGDPYIDRDGDGFAPGPDAPAAGLAELLFLLSDVDDTSVEVGDEIPEDVWSRISAAVLEELLGFEPIRREAQRLGIAE